MSRTDVVPGRRLAPAVAPSDVPRALRLLLVGRAISAVGDGLWFTVWALYLTRGVGLSAAAVGTGMAVAGGCGLLAAVPLGSLADRRSPRDVLVAVIAVRALAMAGYLVVGAVWSFLAVAVPFVALANGGTAVRTALVAGLVDGTATRVRVLAQQRVAQHVGYAAGAALGALVLSVDDLGAYRAAIVLNVVTFAVLAALTARVPDVPPAGYRLADARPGAARRALADLPYVAVTAATSVLALCWAMLSTGLPLWVSTGTHLPVALSGVVVVVSSVGIAALQVPASRLAPSPAAAARTAVASGAALAASCLVLATTGGARGVLGGAVVLVAGLLNLAGELGFVASGWALSVGLMRESSAGAYQGVSEAATATVTMVGPAVFTLAVGGLGGAGWLAVAAVFLVAAAPVPALARWAVATR